MANQKASCKGKPSANYYSNGCRCVGCREAWQLHSAALREAKRKTPEVSKKKPSGGRDKPVVFADAFTREEILRARGM